MKTAKLVTGIVSILLFFLVTFQSCAAGLANTMTGNGEVSGSAGVMVAFCLMVAGIVAIATRSSKGAGGSIACILFYGLGAIIGMALAGSYSDLYIWAVLCAIFAVIHIVSVVTGK